MALANTTEKDKLNPPGSVTEPTPAVPPAAPEMVSLPKELVEKMMAFMENTPKQIERLTAAADKKGLANFDLKTQGAITRTALVSTIGGKIVVAWRMVENEVFQDLNGRWHENQTVEAVFEDLSKETMSLKPDWNKRVEKIKAEIVSQFTTPEGEAMVRLRIADKNTETGTREIDLDEKFVN